MSTIGATTPDGDGQLKLPIGGTRALLSSSCGALEQCTLAASLLSLTLSTLTVISSRKTALELRSRAVLLDGLPDYSLVPVHLLYIVDHFSRASVRVRDVPRTAATLRPDR